MQSFIYHSGYGYSKRLCEDVSCWFLNKFFPRHKIDVEIIHRGLKREGVNGYCDTVEDSSRPRKFLIELDTYMDEELYTATLLHEFVHLKQWVEGKLHFRYGKMCYNKEPVDTYEYWDQPHEVEARELESELHLNYVFDKNGWSDTTKNYFFPNRLMKN